MPQIIVTWHTRRDDKVCPICQALEGQTFILEGQEPQLIYNGVVVWTISQGSDAHGNHSNSCRCTLDFDFNFDDLLEPVKRLHDRFCSGEKLEEPTQI